VNTPEVRSVRCYLGLSFSFSSAFLKILIPDNLFGVGEKICISIIKACVSVDDMRFLLGILRQMNRDDNDIKFK
jgi:hypothetical protein